MYTRALFSVVLGITAALQLSAQSDSVPAGAQIAIRTSETIDARSPSDSRIYRGVVDRDVQSSEGRVLIPSGSNAELILRNAFSNEIVLDLESVEVNGRRYTVSTEPESVQENGKQGVGANKRTGKYVGGGAVLGSIIGAIAGGGKGAAIGAAAGAGAGAVGQTVTKGGNVRLPVESLITFRLDRDLRVAGADNGYDRDGHHYHRYPADERDSQTQRK